MTDRLFDAFEVCLEALQGGAPMEEALALYPDLAAELRPALEAAVAASSLQPTTDVPAAGAQRSLRRLQATAARLRPSPARPPLRLAGFQRLAFAGVAVLLAALLGVGGLVQASAQSLPGDVLYGVTRASEDVSLGLAGSPQGRSELETRYAQRRSEEVRSLLRLGRSASVSFQGVLRSHAGGTWDVDGLPIQVGPDTQIVGDLQDGVTVEVDGTTEGTSAVAAESIHLRAFQLFGEVEAIDRDAWTISGKHVVVAPTTTILSGIRVGDRVLVLMDVLHDGDPIARAIILLGPAVPAATPEPTKAPASASEEWEFEGVVQAVSAQSWTIAGQTVSLTPDSEVEEGLQVGDRARVKAMTTADGRLIALEIQRAGEATEGATGSGETGGGGEHPESDPTPGPTPTGGESGDSEAHESFSGQVTSIQGSVWTIAGRTVTVDANTELNDNPGLNDWVKVDARLVGGQWYAEKIEKD